jgi:hypothetical protein
MRDLNDNEKVIELSKKLPGEVSNPGTIREGDLMCRDSDTPSPGRKQNPGLPGELVPVVLPTPSPPIPPPTMNRANAHMILVARAGIPAT